VYDDDVDVDGVHAEHYEGTDTNTNTNASANTFFTCAAPATLRRRAFKAVPSLDTIEKRFVPFSDCDIDPNSEGCANAM
jgi:hypothetical protein